MNLEQHRASPSSPISRANASARAAGQGSVANSAHSTSASAAGSAANGRSGAFVDLLNVLSAEGSADLADLPIEAAAEVVPDAAELAPDAAQAPVGTAALLNGQAAFNALQMAQPTAAAPTVAVAPDGAGDSSKSKAALAQQAVLQVGASLVGGQAALSRHELAADTAAPVLPQPNAVATATPTDAARAVPPPTSSSLAQLGIPRASDLGDGAILMQKLKDVGLADLTGAGAPTGRAGRSANPQGALAGALGQPAALALQPTIDLPAKGRYASAAQEVLQGAANAAMPPVALLAPASTAVGIAAAALTGSGWTVPGQLAWGDAADLAREPSTEALAPVGTAQNGSSSGQPSGQPGGGGAEVGQGVDWGGWSGLDGAPAAERADPQWSQTLSDQLERWVAQGAQDAELRVENFGGQPVDIAVQWRDGAAWIELRSDHAGARDALAESADQLRQMLEARGLALGNLSVDSQAGRGAPQGDASGQTPRHGGAQRPTLPVGTTSDGWGGRHALPNAHRPGADASGARALDVFA